MELLIVLGVLYGLQCAVWLPGGATLFARPLGGWLVSNGPGWRLLHLLPSGPALLAARPPLVEHEGRLYGRAGATWLSSRGWLERGALADPAALKTAAADGSIVRLRGRPFARALVPGEAGPLARWLRDLGTSDAAPTEAISAALASALDLARYRERRVQLEAATRWLRRSSDLYWGALYLCLPVAMLVWGSEAALLLGAPVLLPLHVWALVSYGRSARRLGLGERRERIESMLAAAFYPPLLLRAYHELRTRSLASFHPAVVAVASLPAAEGRDFLRREIFALSAEGELRDTVGTATRLAEIERQALWHLAGEIGESPESLLAPPQRDDPHARSYCPACRVEYAATTGSCSDCRFALTPYA